VFLGLIIVETVVVHILVTDRIANIAWVLSFIGVYDSLFIDDRDMFVEEVESLL